MNKVMDPQKTAQTMRQFQMENAKMDMTDEMSQLCFLCRLFMHAFQELQFVQIEEL